ncbi:phytoene desaturase family protein [Capillimicrobium parvum]|uniref:Pyridine nucleotide-disulfide oxidoreductase domain-containing protein 2 n=1 Tax=Capillimicrobium parvum TaxID=2884022 RepID=A0A9E6XYZ5_9ACTN|nr:NAD(P)/FAD-dependent oxidoreductase [Capillimicrobium parvum]UGS36351.1 All-trans-zeta-carotene desaturase [Capillimicrobium parvum]
MSARAVVIGSGPNGLAAAIRLAEHGHPVTVLEAGPVPGGAVRTEELTLPGYRHDTFSSVYPAGAASPVFRRMPLAGHGLSWTHPQACYAHPLPGGRAVALYRSLDRTVAGLDAINAGDGQRWAAFAGPLLDAFEALRATMLSGFPPVRGALRLLGALGPVGAAAFGGLVLGSAQGLGRRLFGGEGSRAWLYGSAGHGDVPPTGAGSAIAVSYLNLMGHAVGWPSPRGGAQKLTDALVSYLRALGGDVRTGEVVVGVETPGGRVTAVQIEGGERVGADLVVADVMPHALVGLVGPDRLPPAYRGLMRRYRYGPATLKVDWALDGPIPWEAPEPRGAGTVHVAGGEEELLATIAQSERGLPERPFMLLGQQSLADPTRAPAGHHTAWAYTHGPRTGIDWAAEQARHVERMEAQVERFAPGFRDRILARHVMGPAELQARDRNLVGGDVGGGSYRLPQVVLRPIPSISPYRTPVDGLYLGSAAAFPGGAVHGVPGDAAAAAALRDLKRGRRRRR